MKISVISFILLFLISISGIDAKPRWLKILESKDPDYFKATKKFDKYWKKHFEPGEEEEGEKHAEDEAKEEVDPRPLLVRIFQSEERAKEKSNELLIEYKKFKKWRLEMLPYVKADGKLMTPEERLESWKQLRKFDE